MPEARCPIFTFHPPDPTVHPDKFSECPCLFHLCIKTNAMNLEILLMILTLIIEEIVRVFAQIFG
jgi:hypothetical protein